jgi:hypothetical protein
MSLFDPHNADPDWQRIFGEAAETPPARVWDAIEHELDDDDRGVIVIPFWQRPAVWRLAAAAILLLVGGWLSWQQLENRAVTAENVTKNPRTDKLSTINVDNLQKPGQNVDNITQKTQPQAKSASEDLANKPQVIRKNRPYTAQYQESTEIASVSETKILVLKRDKKIAERDKIKKSTENDIEKPSATTDVFLIPEVDKTGVLNIAFLPARDWKQLAVQTMINPESVVMPQYWAALPSSSVSPPQNQRWLSFGFGSGVFQPSVALRSQPISSPIKTSNPVPDLALGSPVGYENRVQAMAGFEVSRRWFLEAGLGYQRAESVVETPGQVAYSFASSSSYSSSTLYADLLQGLSPSGQVPNRQTNGAPALGPNGNYQTGQINQRSTYHFGQATAQVGYQLRPRKRFGVAVLGGIIANLFVKDAVENGPTIRPADDVYHPISMAGVGGLRFRLRVSRRWSASMAGLYQHSLSSITQPDVRLSVQPQSIMLNGGLDYHF